MEGGIRSGHRRRKAHLLAASQADGHPYAGPLGPAVHLRLAGLHDDLRHLLGQRHLVLALDPPELDAPAALEILRLDREPIGVRVDGGGLRQVRCAREARRVAADDPHGDRARP